MIGMSVGYVIKKSFKLLLLLLGISIIAVFVLEQQGIVVLNEKALNQSVSLGTSGFNYFVAWLKARLMALGFAGGASTAAGFVVGLKMG